MHKLNDDIGSGVRCQETVRSLISVDTVGDFGLSLRNERYDIRILEYNRTGMSTVGVIIFYLEPVISPYIPVCHDTK